jgi:nitrate reductase NapAB chaperone NapD
MQYSGVSVRVRPDAIDAACRRIDAVPGVEVRLRHPDGERLIVVIEADDVDAQTKRLHRVRNVEGVLVAAPVFHFVDDPGEDGAGPVPRPVTTGER